MIIPCGLSIYDVLNITYIHTYIYVHILEPTDEPALINPDQILLADLPHLHRPRQPHAQPELIAQQPQTQPHPFLPVVRQPPQHGAADPHELRTQRQRLEDVGPVPDPAVHVHGDPPLGRGHDLGQGVEGGQGAVELPAAVVGDDDAVDAVLEGEVRVFGRGDAFDPHLHLRRALLLQPADVPLPAQGRVRGVGVECYGALGGLPSLCAATAAAARGLFLPSLGFRRGSAHDGLRRGRGGVFGEVGDFVRFGQFELVADFHVAPPQHGRVDGQEDGLVAGFLGAPDQFLRVVALFEEVELEDSRVVAHRRGDVFEGRCREGGEAHGYVCFFTRFCRGDFAVWVGEALHGGWGYANGYGVAGAPYGDGGVNERYVPQDSGPYAVLAVGGAVFEEGGSRVGAFIVIVAGLLVHAECGVLFQLGDGEAIEVMWLVDFLFGGHCGCFVGWC